METKRMPLKKEKLERQKNLDAIKSGPLDNKKKRIKVEINHYKHIAFRHMRLKKRIDHHITPTAPDTLRSNDASAMSTC
jgi:hypothetical protein